MTTSVGVFVLLLGAVGAVLLLDSGIGDGDAFRVAGNEAAAQSARDTARRRLFLLLVTALSVLQNKREAPVNPGS